MDFSTAFRLTGLSVPDEREEKFSSQAVFQPTQPEISDDALMTATCEGSREALAILFRRYARLTDGCDAHSARRLRSG